jgi:hypothetical protein
MTGERRLVRMYAVADFTTLNLGIKKEHAYINSGVLY